MPRRLYKLILLSLLALPVGVQAKKDKPVNPDYGPTLPIAPPPASANGAIFQIGHYSPLTSGARAARVGDIITINLVERTSASKSTSATTGRNGSLGLSPPVSGPLNLFSAGDVKMSGNQSFNGKGETAQSNALSGELSVTVAAVYPNGNMLVKGEKALTLNRGDENVQFTGIVRTADISVDNRVLSTRVAAARIVYTGKGEIARASQQGWLQRFFSILSPF
jgi:flagellar L-ring protein precursor FlgH